MEELHNWQVQHCDAHPYFKRIPNDSDILISDPAIQVSILRCTIIVQTIVIECFHASKYSYEESACDFAANPYKLIQLLLVKL